MELARPIPKAKSRLTTAYAGWLRLTKGGRRNTWAVRSGDDGAATTAEAVSKPRCIA